MCEVQVWAYRGEEEVAEVAAASKPSTGGTPRCAMSNVLPHSSLTMVIRPIFVTKTGMTLQGGGRREGAGVG